MSYNEMVELYGKENSALTEDEIRVKTCFADFWESLIGLGRIKQVFYSSHLLRAITLDPTVHVQRINSGDSKDVILNDWIVVNVALQ